MIRKLLYTAAALAALGGLALAQGSMGMWSNWPQVGTQPYCSSYVNGSCVNTVAPGESALTGYERIPNDTSLSGGQNPQSQVLTVSNLAQLGEGSERNVLRCPDFFTCLWQRGTTFSAQTPTTTLITADGWGIYSSGNTVTVAKDTTAGDLSPSLGINAAMKITRPSGTNTTAICVSQVLAQKESARFIGREAVFSFSANPLSGFLSTNNNIIATIAVYTASDSATPGTNTDAFAKGTITGYTVINPASGLTTAPSISLASGWNRYAVAGAVPATVLVSGTATAVTGIGVQICTPVYPASTGVAGDGFLLANLQLEATVPQTNTTILGPNGTTVSIPSNLANTIPGSFSRRNPAAEAALEYSFSFVLTDGANTIYYYPGIATTTALAKVIATFPVPMRETPTLTVGTTVSFAVTKADGTAQACGTSIAAVSSSATPFQQTLLCTTGATALVAGNVANLMGAATGGTLTWSAEP